MKYACESVIWQQGGTATGGLSMALNCVEFPPAFFSFLRLVLVIKKTPFLKTMYQVQDSCLSSCRNRLHVHRWKYFFFLMWESFSCLPVFWIFESGRCFHGKSLPHLCHYTWGQDKVPSVPKPRLQPAHKLPVCCVPVPPAESAHVIGVTFCQLRSLASAKKACMCILHSLEVPK